MDCGEEHRNEASPLYTRPPSSCLSLRGGFWLKSAGRSRYTRGAVFCFSPGPHVCGRTQDNRQNKYQKHDLSSVLAPRLMEFERYWGDTSRSSSQLYSFFIAAQITNTHTTWLCCSVCWTSHLWAGIRLVERAWVQQHNSDTTNPTHPLLIIFGISRWTMTLVPSGVWCSHHVGPLHACPDTGTVHTVTLTFLWG